MESYDLDKRSAKASASSGKWGGSHPNQGFVEVCSREGLRVQLLLCLPSTKTTSMLRLLFSLCFYAHISAYLHKNCMETITKHLEEVVVCVSVFRERQREREGRRKSNPVEGGKERKRESCSNSKPRQHNRARQEWNPRHPSPLLPFLPPALLFSTAFPSCDSSSLFKYHWPRDPRASGAPDGQHACCLQLESKIHIALQTRMFKHWWGNKVYRVREEKLQPWPLYNSREAKAKAARP